MTNQSTNGWNKDGSLTTSMQFKNFNSTTNLACANVTDQFAVGNISAKLTYPVSLISNEEWYNIGTDSLRQTGVNYWGLSPSFFFNSAVSVRGVNYDGSLYVSNSGSGYGSRPAVTLSTGAVVSSGDGSEERPWVIQE